MSTQVSTRMVEGLESLIQGMISQLQQPDIGDYCFSAAAAKPKWLACDGSEYSRTTYSDLFSVIGTAFGAGDGVNTFNVPDAVGRMPMASGVFHASLSVAAADVNVGFDRFPAPSNADAWLTGTIVTLTSTGALPDPLVAGTTYIVIRNGAWLHLATDFVNAMNNVKINLTTTGTGVHTISRYPFVGSSRIMGDVGGSDTHLLLPSEMPPHAHSMQEYDSANMTANGPLWSDTAGAARKSTFGPAATQTVGGAVPFNLMPPYISLGNLFIFAGV